MAKHFKQDVAKTTVAARPLATKRRATPVQSGDTSGQVSLPYGDVAPYRYSYPEAIRTDEAYYDEGEGFARGGLFKVGRGFFLLLALPMRLAAIALFVIVILNAMPIPAIGEYVMTVTDFITSHLPWRDMRILAVDTPFSGAFRIDLCLLSFFFFVLDWLFCRIRAALV